MEKWARTTLPQADAGPEFVAAFAQSNVGDTSPNVLGAYCADTGAKAAACQNNVPVLPSGTDTGSTFALHGGLGPKLE